MASREELSGFLAAVERRAFKQAVFALRDDESALDAVQDAMMKLAEKYADRPAEEFPMLFQRILQNVIRDMFRRRKVRSTWTTLLSSFTGSDEDDDYDPLDNMVIDEPSELGRTPEQNLEQSEVMALIEREISRLPTRQREAFLMRYWEELDIAETAAVMGCSEGSVKTHCSRATHALAAALKLRGIKL
ncbi:MULTISPECIES: RNA polymerase sigma factor [Methyloversatilis]|uniref:RNA polymerase sigma factor n=1 Tax=Methyloversatilis TaxID=378210 RepID=UPI0009DBB042|nr:RNA polymerase sigma factor [Methyloversatilis discipulorum]MBT9517657.1 RNA polymerase sigma factor [Methyloversatilis discipulorum]PZU51461.1 MAG: RNA polymerase sigma factor [Thauera sp.]